MEGYEDAYAVREESFGGKRGDGQSGEESGQVVRGMITLSPKN
jgi:hypothetical protein